MTNTRQSREAQTRGFTLIELLAVMGVIAVLVTLGVFGFQGVGRGSKAGSAVSQLKTTIHLARQWAITHNEKAYVVFPDDEPSLYGAGAEEHAPKALRSYNVYTRSDGYVGNWQYLPEGVLFALDDSTYSDINNAKSILNYIEPINWPEFINPSSNLPVLTFLGDGSLESGTEIEVYLAEGTIDANPVTGNIGNLNYLPDAVSMLYGLQVTPFTGGVRVRDYRDDTP